MRFIANPDKFVFFIGVGIVGFLFIFSYMLLKQLVVLVPALILWIVFTIYLIRINYVEYIIHGEKIIIKYMKKNFEINFDEIDYIVQRSNYTNIFKAKKYELKLNNKLNVPDKLLKIENKTFTKWILKQSYRFKIKKKMYID